LRVKQKKAQRLRKENALIVGQLFVGWVE